ncbi:MAG: COX aromatic rich motif-containing protein [Gammaproteobacteria bacterium]|nr:COX aromatic rich motif-containing protein [Gammaproteobacteria bacterium]
MVRNNLWRAARALAAASVLLLSGCVRKGGLVLLDPKGPIAAAELHFTILDVVIMLGIIVPTAILVIWFMWHYRATNRKARYDGRWDHSYGIEVVVWGIPILVVAVLSYFSYKGIFEVDPYNPRILDKPHVTAATARAGAPASRPVDVNVITTDWQWLFVYPKLHIASVDKLVVPVNTPVRFRLTSATVDNAFMIPQLVGQIEIMPGMRTKQALLASHLGTYRGFSAEMSGPGFAWMQFHADVVSAAHFRKWAAMVAKSPDHMTDGAFDAFAQPTFNLHEKSRYFSQVQPGLFRYVIHQVHMGKVFTTPLGAGELMTAHMTRVQ